VDAEALTTLARRAAAHRWMFTRGGLEAGALALGWQVADDGDDPVTLRTGGRFDPAWALFIEDHLELVEATLVPPVDVSDVYGDPDRITEIAEQMRTRFVEAAGVVEAAIGKPSFQGPYGAPGYPEDEEAEWLAVWDTETARLAVHQSHQDQELPFTLSFVIQARWPD
jgi:hypothetical protein